MKTLRPVLAAAGLLLLAGSARAQTYGCRASVNCYGPRGFSTQSGASMGTYPAFTVGMTYSSVGGLRARWNPPGFGLPEKPDKDAIDGAVGIFLERNPALKAQMKPAAPAKTPASAAPKQDAKKAEPEGDPSR